MRILPVLWFIALLAYSFVTLFAFVDGAKMWFGWDTSILTTIILVILFVVLAVARLTILTLPLVYYGALSVWHWEWWKALLFTIPGIFIMVIGLLGGGVVALWERYFVKS